MSNLDALMAELSNSADGRERMAGALYFEPDTGARTALVRMAAGTAFPPHEHRGTEDVYLLEGEMWVGEVQMRPGDYCRAPEGSDHADVRSGPQGSLSVVVSR